MQTRKRSIVWFPVAVSLALAMASGCTILFDTKEARRPGPSAPAVRISPGSPHTGDDLVATVTTESIDSKGDPITYHFAWTKQGSDEVLADTATLPHALTTRNEVFTVTVTPEAGRRPGQRTQTSVTIANSAPVLAYAGLSRYDLFREESLEAFLGPTSDADGDPVSHAITWRVDGQVVSESSAQLLLDALPATGGERIEVSISPSDGTNVGEAVTVGPAVVRMPGTQWRQLVPSSRRRVSVYDARHRRFLHFIPRPTLVGAAAVPNIDVWEYAIDVRRWALLSPANPEGGAFPLLSDLFFSPLPYVDEARGRVVFFSVADATTLSRREEVRVLDIAKRGSEAWRILPLSPTSEIPPYFLGGTAVVDEARDRALVHGGMTNLGGVVQYDDATFTRAIAHLPFGPLVGAVWMRDPNADVAYLAGGTSALGANTFPPIAGRTDVWRLDLATTTFDATPIASLDASVVLASSVTLATDRSAWLVHGMRSFAESGPSAIIRRFDLDTLTFSNVTLDGGAPVDPSSLAGVGYDPYEARVVHVPGMPVLGPDGTLPASMVSITPTGAVSPIDIYGVTSPPALSRLSATYDAQGSFMLYFGRRSPAEVGALGVLSPSSVFLYDAQSHWSPSTLEGATTTGRFGYGFGTAFTNTERYFVGGTSASGGSTTPVTELLELVTGNSPPWRSRGQMLGDFSRATIGRCGLGLYFIFGGADADAGTRTPVSSFSPSGCVTGGSCSPTPITSNLPTTTLGVTTVALPSGSILTIGGASHGDVIHRGDPCAPAPQTWESIPVPDLPDTLAFVKAFAIDATHVLVMGTWHGGETHFPFRFRVAMLDITDVAAPTFVEVAPTSPVMPWQERYHFAADGVNGRRILLYGGDDEPAPDNETRTYADLWELSYEP